MAGCKPVAFKVKNENVKPQYSSAVLPINVASKDFKMGNGNF
jgi:hypothetical protein